MGFWQRHRVVITGGTGFLGSHVTRILEERSPAALFAVGKEDYDLVRWSEVAALFETLQPTIVLHLAAVVGGIGANRENPGRFFYENLMMGAQVIEHCRTAGVERLTVVGTICSYPKLASVPFREEMLWTGYPEETNAPYGVAKLALLEQLQAYRRQYGLSGIYLMPVNLYGPGDNFDPQSSHVIPALIRKCVEAVAAGDSTVSVWGSGEATREFLYVEDAAEGIVGATERFSGAQPVNLGAGFEISIRDLAVKIAEQVGFKGDLIFDVSKPDGQPRRSLDTTRARELWGFQASVDLDEGIRRAVDWYLTHDETPSTTLIR